ncbi:YfbM family protein [Treponema primitia]|uniref:YfbM family protein n=1 Tax=Treponema primitia TaxID=88058 RepID=UPI00397EDEDE
MELLGFYMMVDEFTLDKLVIFNANHRNELKDTNENYLINKLWDGLHFLLTGSSAYFPVKNNKLSESIVGVHILDTKYDHFIACIKNNEVPEIYNAMKNIDIKELEKKFDPKTFKKNKIHPNIWKQDKRKELFQELISEYNGLLEFYQRALTKNVHIIFSVF